MTGEVANTSFGYDHVALAKWLGTLAQPVRCVYESGITGCDLFER